MKKIAIILLSGGLDSTTALAVAQSEGWHCHALSFDYGQKQSAELTASKRIAHTFQVTHHLVVLDTQLFRGSALTESGMAIPCFGAGGDPIPSTYVPARNTIFLSMALGLAESLGAQAIFMGVNSVDYSGYPDCRPDYIRAFQAMANLATKAAIEGNPCLIQTPLMHWDKATIIQKGLALGVDYAQTVSCYAANDLGQACGRCDSCAFRRLGFEQAGIQDPTRYQAQSASQCASEQE